MSIECPRCTSYNADGALHCDQCGTPLAGGGGGSSRGGSGKLVALLVLLLVVVGAWAIRDPGTPRPSPGTGGSEARSGESPGGRGSGPAFGRPAPIDSDPVELLTDDPEAPAGRLVAGWLQIEDAHETVLERIPTAATRGGWLAVPRRAALGGRRWVFRPGLGGETEVLDGIWRPGETVGLWRIDSPDSAASPPLGAWIEGAPMTFVSYSGNRREVFEELPVGLRQTGLFLHAETPTDLGRGGILLQEGNIVGWVTGEPEPGLWLWIGDPGGTLAPERTVEEFYLESFAGGQEEAVSEAHALAADEATNRTRVLEAYRRALVLPTRLRPEETRDIWAPTSAVPAVLRAMRTLLDDDAPQSILIAFDLPTVTRLGDGGVFILYLDAIAAVEGPVNALSVADRLGARLVPPASEWEEPFLARVLAFFRDALVRALDDGDIRRAWALVEDGRRRFPEDPELYLAEVELWLDEGDWRRGEELLSAVSFPSKFRERVARLERRIAELKGTEGKIVIRFPAGASTISTHADIGGVRQHFIVDTGASYTAVPWSTVDALGIVVDANTPRRQLRTASDVISAPIVTLPSVTLGGWTVEGVEATVIDLPGNESIGLLGLNYLGEFRVDLDRDAGILTLEPR